ncbi:acyl-CoA dehydrogenase [Mycobacterium asiaticum]|uniref:Acyl-CoA dehydrogenase n=1 Tax=Mycobacterium asiaticum TaxID=1790 RepID=A0A1A3NM45_MYCAS|nr:acyl-CoA dehydrogenase family protein [Mycobacterium asiaticum]OBK21407.1 acyl-CoA dehydrogenase [Mycobacterium asiaticum]
MDFRYSTEQDDFRASLRGFLCQHAATPGLWEKLCVDLELPGLSVPAEYGGAGATLLEAAIACTELGRALCPVPFLGNAFAIETILRMGDSGQCKSLLPGLLSGARVAAFAGSEPGVAADLRHGSSVLTGECSPVLHGHIADLFVVPAVLGGETAGYVVRADTPGVAVGQLPSFDPTRPVAKLRLTDAPAEALTGGTAADLERVFDVARVLVAAEMLGGAEACLDMAVEYACNRKQFDRPIGSFQAIKHACADMMIEIDATRAAVMFAVMTAVSGDELHIAAPLAKAQAADTFVQCAEAAIQIHGGIAFTWEHSLHLYYRRAKTTAALFGSSAQHRALLADRAGL